MSWWHSLRSFYATRPKPPAYAGSSIPTLGRSKIRMRRVSRFGRDSSSRELAYCESVSAQDCQRVPNLIRMAARRRLHRRYQKLNRELSLPWAGELPNRSQKWIALRAAVLRLAVRSGGRRRFQRLRATGGVVARSKSRSASVGELAFVESRLAKARWRVQNLSIASSVGAS